MALKYIERLRRANGSDQIRSDDRSDQIRAAQSLIHLLCSVQLRFRLLLNAHSGRTPIRHRRRRPFAADDVRLIWPTRPAAGQTDEFPPPAAAEVKS